MNDPNLFILTIADFEKIIKDMAECKKNYHIT